MDLLAVGVPWDELQPQKTNSLLFCNPRACSMRVVGGNARRILCIGEEGLSELQATKTSLTGPRLGNPFGRFYKDCYR